MPSVTYSYGNLQQQGPSLEVHFHIPDILTKKYKEEGKQVPEPVICKAIVDTGASGCTIKPEIPEKLGLKPIGTTKINTASHKDNECYQYFLRMVIPAQGIFWEGIFVGTPLDGQDISCLIGRDLLNISVLVYNGPM